MVISEQAGQAFRSTLVCQSPLYFLTRHPQSEPGKPASLSVFGKIFRLSERFLTCQEFFLSKNLTYSPKFAIFAAK